ncbi:type 1 periplasmic binding fold superfamily protein [uncultured Allomuricauda sp.]|uniref:type 1 periplasmic binding fold superfamily protein n=1 Tax=Allomuricauda sp. R78024 TaxID=3093867 RepID=UPI00262F6DCF|nr:type 1 periplasmic binding fold superfamily protein [uncultured Allomuricauda sp.]
MKTTKFLSLALLTGTLLVGCSSDDNDPEVINPEETITTMNVTLTPQGGGTAITLQSQDLDGDGPNPPMISISGSLAENTVYDGTVELLNETETPAESINEEIEGEAAEHQFFFIPNNTLNATIAYDDDESDYVSAETGVNFTSTNPVGISFTVTTTDASTGTLAITLRHEPKKPNDGTLADAGGETDITQAFTLVIE